MPTTVQKVTFEAGQPIYYTDKLTLYAQWPGLQLNLFPSEDSYIDTILAAGFTELRHMVLQNQNIADSKAKCLSWIAKGAKVIWGIGANTPLTDANWPTFRLDVLAAAQWAQDNGIFEFEIGNEEEYHIDGTTLTQAQLIVKLKALATEVQAIYTRGNVSYALGHDQTLMEAWNVAGRGNIDLLSLNSYVGLDTGWDWWKSKIDWAVSRTANFGTHCWLSEFNLNVTSLATYSADEAVQAAALATMINYIRDAGITRASYFQWKGTNFGIVKNDETYRQLWVTVQNYVTPNPSIEELNVSKLVFTDDEDLIDTSSPVIEYPRHIGKELVLIRNKK